MGFDQLILKVLLLIIRARIAYILTPRLGSNQKSVLLAQPQNHHLLPQEAPEPRNSSAWTDYRKQRLVRKEERVMKW